MSDRLPEFCRARKPKISSTLCEATENYCIIMFPLKSNIL